MPQTTVRPVREILIATPDEMPDLYRTHQLVWDHAQRAATSRIRPSFLFRVEPGLVRVRSCDFARGASRQFRPGVAAHIDLAAVIQTDAGERAVAHAELSDWALVKLDAAGFEVKDLEVLGYQQRVGEKRDRASGRLHKIAIPVASVRVEMAIRCRQTAEKAWRDGIGRGKRFGLGMISQ